MLKSINGLMLNIPALLNSTSTVPYSSIVTSNIFLTSSRLDMSAITYIASFPSALMSSTTAFALSSFLPVTTTFAPSCANSFADALPIPDVAPVTIATFPSNFAIINFSLIKILFYCIIKEANNVQ